MTRFNSEAARFGFGSLSEEQAKALIGRAAHVSRQCGLSADDAARAFKAFGRN